jgi:DNA invertase Pin-like site-specific DNA recombinase
MTTAALYARVSTAEQTTANQVDELHRLATARGWEPALYEEKESAAKRRPILDRLMDDARRGKVRAVVVWALDRLDRNMLACLSRVVELDRLGVPVVSVREPWLDTSGPTRSLLVAVFGWVAEQERARLIERTRAGLDRARREGKRLGRPRTSSVLLHAAAEMVAHGEPVAAAARAKGVSRAALRRWLAENPTAPGAVNRPGGGGTRSAARAGR